MISVFNSLCRISTTGGQPDERSHRGDHCNERLHKQKLTVHKVQHDTELIIQRKDSEIQHNGDITSTEMRDVMKHKDLELEHLHSELAQVSLHLLANLAWEPNGDAPARRDPHLKLKHWDAEAIKPIFLDRMLKHLPDNNTRLLMTSK